MKEVRVDIKEDAIVVNLSGHINSNNASTVEAEAEARIPNDSVLPVVVDAEHLEYISSAGLRVLLHLRKAHHGFKIINTNTEVYEILDMTGFTQMMPVEKAYRIVSVEGCEEIGRGANGTIYRIDRDNVVKVYNNADALEEIQHEREVARTALILGIPTAISYDVVRVGNSYGSVFELLNARSFSKIIANEPERMDWCVKEYVKMLRTIHGTRVPEGKLPDLKDTVLSWARFMRDYLPDEAGRKLLRLVQAVPHSDYMVHGDYHTKNLELVEGDEVLLIDMDTLAVGDPIFEFASMYNAFQGYGEYDHSITKSFLGVDYDVCRVFWHKVLEEYLGTNDETRIQETEDKARIIGYTRMIRRSIRRGGLESEKGRAEIELWTDELKKLLDRINTLQFRADELVVPANLEQLSRVMNFVGEHMEAAGCSPKTSMQIDIAVEEVFTNLSKYAYPNSEGDVIVRASVNGNPAVGTITFIDCGVEYNPLANEDPDITLSAEEREIGGLGIFMVKKSMDDMKYEYIDGNNILTLKKILV